MTLNHIVSRIKQKDMKHTSHKNGGFKGRSLLVLICGLLSTGLVDAQSITWQIVNAAGFTDGPEISLRWTIGEPMTLEVGDATATLRVGFMPFAYVEESTSASSALDPEIDITVSPNPASDQIHVRLPGVEIYTVRILSMNGSASMATEIISQAAIDIRALPEGAYVLYAISPEGKFNTQTFIKS